MKLMKVDDDANADESDDQVVGAKWEVCGWTQSNNAQRGHDKRKV